VPKINSTLIGTVTSWAKIDSRVVSVIETARSTTRNSAESVVCRGEVTSSSQAVRLPMVTCVPNRKGS
jgi:hypothetical protein